MSELCSPGGGEKGRSDGAAGGSSRSMHCRRGLAVPWKGRQGSSRLEDVLQLEDESFFLFSDTSLTALSESVPWASAQGDDAVKNAIDLRYQYVDPQANGAETHPVELPQYSNFGTNHAFLNKADGSGQSTKDLSHFQQLAVKQAKKKAHGPWKPLPADKLFHFKGVQFKGFNKRKAAMLHKLKERAKMQMKHTRRDSEQPKQLWPSSVIAGSGPQAPAQQNARPVFNSDMPTSPMGTNGVFLGSHQGGDSSFSHHGGAPQATAPNQGRAGSFGSSKPNKSPYLSITHKASPHMLYSVQRKQKQLWPSSVIGQQPDPRHDMRPRPWTSGADGAIIPGSAVGRRVTLQRLSFSNGGGAGPAAPTMKKQGTSWAPKADPYGRRMPFTMGADGSLMGQAGCVGSTS